MNIKIGNKIKELRGERHITQDQLATYLGVTPQAISRWEAGNGYPDIETLPALADFFGVTSDELLGIKKSEREARLAEIYKEIKRLDEVGTEEENLAFARQAVAEFPSEEELQLNLAGSLGSIAYWSDAPDQAMLDEAGKILNTLIDTTENDDMRYQALETLVIHYEIGTKNRKAALETAKRMPLMKYSREEVMAFCLKGSDSLTYVQELLDRYISPLASTVRTILLDENMPNDPSTWGMKIEMLRKTIKIYDLIYGDDLKYNHGHVARLYWLMSTYQMSLGKTENALDSLEHMCHHVVARDKSFENEHGTFFSSPFVDHVVYPFPSEDFHELLEHSQSWYFLHDYIPHERYDSIREDARFRSIVAKLEEHAR